MAVSEWLLGPEYAKLVKCKEIQNFAKKGVIRWKADGRRVLYHTGDIWRIEADRTPLTVKE